MGDYLPTYKLSPEMSTIVTFIESNDHVTAHALLDKLTAAPGDTIPPDLQASGLEPASLRLLQKSVLGTRSDVPVGDRSSTSGNSGEYNVRLEVSLAAALPPHASDESELEAARASVLAIALDGKMPANSLDANVAQKAAALWATDMNDICSGFCGIHPVGSGLIGTAPSVVLTVPLADVPAVVSYLATQSDVNWISPSGVIRQANYYSTAINQGGQCESTLDTSNLSNSNYVYNDEGKHPIWQAGLTGVLWQSSSRVCIEGCPLLFQSSRRHLNTCRIT